MTSNEVRLRFSGARMREKRIAIEMTQIVLAYEVDTSPSVIIGYETGKVMPSINRVLNICAALGCGVEDLCEEDS